MLERKEAKATVEVREEVPVCLGIFVLFMTTPVRSFAFLGL